VRLSVAICALCAGCLDFGDIPLEEAMAPAPVAPVSVGNVGDDDPPLEGVSDGVTDAPGPVECGPVTVEMRKLKFRPKSLTVCVGDTITFINKDLVAHNVIEGAPSVDAHEFQSAKLGTSESWQVAFSKPGQITVYCGTHKKKMRDMIITVVP